MQGKLIGYLHRIKDVQEGVSKRGTKYRNQRVVIEDPDASYTDSMMIEAELSDELINNKDIKQFLGKKVQFTVQVEKAFGNIRILIFGMNAV